ncbi:hypothetical protein [Laspinema olomoucense]|uniref:hypothetical protein n=1 Tax=Laspinema olomoucense TaxID=3231600 RepID=UPI0021BB7E89|nr:hypothetical protein [Laspinema sp. D3d]MCT7971209.1 hypothetical protein [Laspinema sp. D3d]
MKEYTGIVIFVAESLREYSNEVGYENDETFRINDVITDGEFNYRIKSFQPFQEDEEVGVFANCEVIWEEEEKEGG